MSPSTLTELQKPDTTSFYFFGLILRPKAFRRRVIIRSRPQVSRFHQLTSLDAAYKKFGLKRIKLASRRVAWIDVATDDMDQISAVLVLILVAIGFVSAPIFAARLTPLPSTPGEFLAMLTLYAVFVVVGFWIILPLGKQLVDWNLGFAALYWYGLFVVLALVAIVGISRGHALPTYPWVTYSISAFTIAVLFILIGSMLIWFIGNALARFWGHMGRLLFPESVIAAGLVDALSQIETFKAAPLTFQVRNFILDRLEESAAALESGVPRHLRSGDAVTLAWCRKVAGAAAARLRFEKQLFALGLVANDPQVIDRFAGYVRSALTENWALIEPFKPERETRRQRLQRVAKLAEGFMIASIPGIVLWLLWDRLALTSPFSEYVKVGAILWGAAALALSWDPNFAARLLSLRNFASSLGSSKE